MTYRGGFTCWVCSRTRLIDVVDRAGFVDQSFIGVLCAQERLHVRPDASDLAGRRQLPRAVDRQHQVEIAARHWSILRFPSRAKMCPMRADLTPGAAFPDIQLPDWQGKMQKLSELQGPDPMVLVFYRGLY
jgi:hypothetical protein